MGKTAGYNWKSILYGSGLVLAACIMWGCNGESGNEAAPVVTIEEYQKNVYQTTDVKKGTIEPALTLTLTPDQFEIKQYSMDTEEMLKVAELNVEEGSHVTEGQVMAVFENDGLQEKIDEYEQRKEEDRLLAEHYQKLAKIDSAQDYAKDIKKLKEDISLMDSYIEETKAELKDFQLIASKAGTVTKIEEDLKKGFVTGNYSLISVVSGSSDYIAETADDYAFQIGDTYEAAFQLAVYEMKVIAVEETEGRQRITFEPVSDMTGVAEQDKLSMTIKKTPIKNAVYVEQTAIHTIDDKDYAFTVDENGYRHAVLVTVKEVVDEYAIIADGLKEGEQVTLN